MPKKQKSFRKKYKKGGENTSSTERKRRRAEIREKTAAAAERRQNRQTYRQPSYRPRQRRNLRKYLTMNRGNTNIRPLEQYEIDECIGSHCGYLHNPQYMSDIRNRALRRRNRDLLMSEFNSRIIPEETRQGEMQYRLSKNRRKDLPYLDKHLQDKIGNFMY